MLRLDNSFAQGHFTVTVVGCGGTGRFVAEGLARLLPPSADLVLIDHDRVEERNLTRQNFRRDELGRFKAAALAQRLSQTYSIPVGYSTFPVHVTELRYPGIIVGCVDNGMARRQIAQRVSKRSLTWVGGYSRSLPQELQQGPQRATSLWWVDAGNGENFGQVLIGNSDHFAEENQQIVALPMPTVQRPDILQEVPVQMECANIPEQGPVINQVMAGLVVEVVRRLIDGSCSWMALYLDLQSGTLSPVIASPQNVAKIVRARKGVSRRN